MDVDDVSFMLVLFIFPPLGKLTLISTAVFLVFSICYVLNLGKPIEVDDFQLELIYWMILRSPPNL